MSKRYSTLLRSSSDGLAAALAVKRLSREGTFTFLEANPDLPEGCIHPYGVFTCIECNIVVVSDMLTGNEVYHLSEFPPRIESDTQTKLWDLEPLGLACSICSRDD